MSLVFADSDEQGRQEYGQSEIISGTFWPRIDLSDLRNVMRIDTNVSSSRLYHAAIDGVAHVNGQLRAWKKQAQQNSISLLHELDDPEDYINGESVRVSYYRRAVYCYTKAILLETWADAEATGKSGERAEAKQNQAEDYRREAHFAVASLMGKSRCDSELI
ncbi:head completion/stabilization protein [Neisseria sp. P0009.S001]|jgi:hypothetical protein|uniref:head completion/stabilization protein n=1 Tax=unclassified Neisseria TaxID=2623750 RepID=UPI00204945FC|nr:MAG TPA: head completion protein [Caudoviricetes sp.]